MGLIRGTVVSVPYLSSGGHVFDPEEFPVAKVSKTALQLEILLPFCEGFVDFPEEIERVYNRVNSGIVALIFDRLL